MPAFSDDTMFRYSAATYLRIWISQDRGYVRTFNFDLSTQAAANLLREYKVIRSFHRQNPNDGHERFQKLVNVLVRVRDQYPRRRGFDPVQAVNAVNGGFIRHYQSPRIKNFVSAASKTTWMLFRHPVAIYDSLACVALHADGFRFTNGDYESYHNAWTQFRADRDDNIRAASAWLPRSDYARRISRHGVASLQQIHRWSSSEWFRNRICDQRLVWLGSNDDLAPADLAAYISHSELA